MNCGECKHFTEFGSCDIHEYNLIECIKNNYIDYEDKQKDKEVININDKEQ